MEITLAQYMKSPTTNEICAINCVIDGEKSSVPLDPDNTHYAEILKQVKEGKLTIKDAD